MVNAVNLDLFERTCGGLDNILNDLVVLSTGSGGIRLDSHTCTTRMIDLMEDLTGDGPRPSGEYYLQRTYELTLKGPADLTAEMFIRAMPDGTIIKSNLSPEEIKFRSGNAFESEEMRQKVMLILEPVRKYLLNETKPK
ncbi:MAG: hypothetical protein HYT16_00650 [DPANN group archaeon]|nr:hypothetical protein [DPANN group archaeon]